MSKSRPWVYLLLVAAALVAMMLVSGVHMLDTEKLQGTSSMRAAFWGEATGAVGFSIALFCLAIFLYRYSRRTAMLQAEHAMSEDPRRPILFLRSFTDDRELKIRARLANGRLPFETLFRIPFEEALSDHLWRYGPVIAIADPNQKPRSPPLGASRMALPEDWRSRIAELSERAALVVAVLGRTSGLAWELEWLLGSPHAEKLVVLFPPLSPALLRARWMSAACNIPGMPSVNELPFERLRAIRWNSSGPQLLLVSSRDAMTYEVVIDQATSSLIADRPPGSTPPLRGRLWAGAKQILFSSFSIGLIGFLVVAMMSKVQRLLDESEKRPAPHVRYARMMTDLGNSAVFKKTLRLSAIGRLAPASADVADRFAVRLDAAMNEPDADLSGLLSFQALRGWVATELNIGENESADLESLVASVALSHFKSLRASVRAGASFKMTRNVVRGNERMVRFRLWDDTTGSFAFMDYVIGSASERPVAVDVYLSTLDERLGEITKNAFLRSNKSALEAAMSRAEVNGLAKFLELREVAPRDALAEWWHLPASLRDEKDVLFLGASVAARVGLLDYGLVMREVDRVGLRSPASAMHRFAYSVSTRDFETSLSALDTMEELLGSDAIFHLLRARVHLLRGSDELATKHALAALRVEPNWDSALRTLLVAQLNTVDRSGAIETILKAEASEVSLGNVYDLPAYKRLVHSVDYARQRAAIAGRPPRGFSSAGAAGGG